MFLTSALTFIVVHRNFFYDYAHRFHVNYDNINSIIIGDSIVVGLTCYTNVWKNLFGNEYINLGIRGKHAQWRVRDTAFPPRLILYE